MTLGARRLGHLLLVAAAAIVVVLGGSDPASAHFAGGREPSSYRGEITEIAPALPGVSVRLLDAADRIEVRSTSATPVIVYGYQHKEPGGRDPYLKISADGVWVNTESQAGYLNETLYGAGDAVPEGLRDDLGDGEPVWKQVSDEGVYRWHDHRIHWMSADPPPQVAADPDTEHHVIRDWKIYAQFGDQPETTITGQLYWTPASPTPWWLLTGGLAVVALASGLRWHRRPMIIAVGGLAAAALLQAGLVPLPIDDYQGSWTFVLASAAVPALAVAGLCWLGIAALRRASDSARYLIGAAAALAVLQATSDLPTITRSQLEHSGPDWLIRLAVAAAVGLGVGLLVAVVVRSLRSPIVGGGVDIASDEEMQRVRAAAPILGRRDGRPRRAQAG